MSVQEMFFYPSNIMYEFLLSLFGFYSLGNSVDLLGTIAIAILFWVKIFKILDAVIRRLTGFEKLH